jgi:DHA2 family multidrug resistance protein
MSQGKAVSSPESDKAHEAPATRSWTNPYIGILGVFLGAGLATLSARLLSVGLADLRGAKGFGFDEASWLPTALNMATMFSGVFVVFVNVFFGPRKILLYAAAIFAAVSMLLPFVGGYWQMLLLLVITGLSSGTFYSLTMTFVLTALPKRLIIFGIAAYAADIVFVSNIASLLEGWYIDYFSWKWIFWTSAVATPLMMLCVYFGIPRRPPSGPAPSWRGFAYFSSSLALLYGALDQGERLDWLNSGVFVAMLTGGLFLFIATCVRRFREPNPTLNIAFLNSRNIIILCLSIFVFKFVHLGVLILVPGFLGNIQHYRPLQTGHALAWVAIPMFAVVWLIAAVVIRTNSRLTLTVGLTIVATACWICSHLDSSWSGSNFETLELVLAVGLAASYVGLVSSIVLEGLESGALKSATNAATLSGMAHFVRLFGGEVGVAFMNRIITVRERFHSNMLGLNVQFGDWLTDERIHALTARFSPSSSGGDEAQFRAIDLLGQQVRGQAYTMAVSDGFILIGWIVVVYLIMMLFLKPGRISYRDLGKMQ